VEAFEPSQKEAIRALAEEIAQRIRLGERRAIVRAGLIAGGLSAEFVDGILAGIQVPTRRSVGSIMAIVLSVTALVVFPVVGAIGGVWVAWPSSPDEECGMWVFPALLFTACAGLLGLAMGVGLAFAAVWGLSELSDGTTRDT